MAAFKYEYSNGFYRKASPQTVGEVCEQLEKSERGLTPQALLDASRDENAPLHNEFEWDDTVAAEKWRLEQARLLIANIRIVRSNDEQERNAYKERGFVSTPGNKGVYVGMQTALNQEKLRSYLLDQAKRDSQSFIAKYRRLQELAEVCEAMESFIEKVG